MPLRQVRFHLNGLYRSVSYRQCGCHLPHQLGECHDQLPKSAPKIAARGGLLLLPAGAMVGAGGAIAGAAATQIQT
jgi:hypothetical protein